MRVGAPFTREGSVLRSARIDRPSAALDRLTRTFGAAAYDTPECIASSLDSLPSKLYRMFYRRGGASGEKTTSAEVIPDARGADHWTWWRRRSLARNRVGYGWADGAVGVLGVKGQIHASGRDRDGLGGEAAGGGGNDGGDLRTAEMEFVQFLVRSPPARWISTTMSGNCWPVTAAAHKRGPAMSSHLPTSTAQKPLSLLIGQLCRKERTSIQSTWPTSVALPGIPGTCMKVSVVCANAAVDAAAR